MKRKINKKKVLALVVLNICSILLLNDVYMIVIKNAMFTWLGLITNMYLLFLIVECADYLNRKKD